MKIRALIAASINGRGGTSSAASRPTEANVNFFAAPGPSAGHVQFQGTRLND